MNTLAKSILSVLLVSLLLSARPTFAGDSSHSGTCPGEGPTLAATHSTVAAAQDAPSTVLIGDEIPEALQKALAELDGRRKEVAALRLAIGARDDKIRILEGIIAQQADIIALWKTAARERATANAADAKIEASYKASVTNYELELARVRIDRDRQASRKKWWGLAGLVAGVVIGVLASQD